MLSCLKHNWPLLPGILLLLLSLKYYKFKHFPWATFDDEVSWKHIVLGIIGFILFFIGVYYKFEYLEK